MRGVHSIVIALALMLSTMLIASPVSAQTTYNSPTFGYSVTLPSDWTVESESSDGTGDVLRFTNGEVVAFLTSFATDQTPTACIEEAVATIEARPRHDDFEFAESISEENGKATALFGYTFVTAAGEQLDGRDRMTCWALPEAGGMVRLEFLLLERDLVAQDAAMSAVETAVEAALAPMTAGADSGVAAATPIEAEDTSVQDAGSATATPETGAALASPTAEAETSVEDAASATATSEAGAALPSPSDEAGEAIPGIEPGVTGNSYVSPTYGFGLTWSDAWTVTDEQSDTRGDYLGLEHGGGIFADLIAESYPQDVGSCFEFVVDYYSNHEDYANVVASPDPVSAAPGVWEFTGLIEMTAITDSGDEIEIVDYLSCSHIPGRSAIVTLEISSLAESVDQLRPEMDALRQGFALSAAGQTADGTDIPGSPTAEIAGVTATTEASPASAVASGVSGSSYLSPMYGYRLTWDDTWTVDAESSEDGRDYLALTNGAVYAELLSEPWDATQENCFEWIVEFYMSNPDYVDVRASQDAVSAAPGAWEVTGAIALTDADATTDAQRINYVACTAIPGQDVVVSLEQFVYPIDAPGQLNAMDALRAGFALV